MLPDYPIIVNHAFSPSDLKTLELSLKTEEPGSLKRPRSPADAPPTTSGGVKSTSQSAAADPKNPPEGFVYENHKLKKLKVVENKIIYVSFTGKVSALTRMSSVLDHFILVETDRRP